jgi:hypothetical protein
MAKVKPNPLAPDAVPRARGILLVQPYRGGVAARRWPRKRGQPKDPRQRYLLAQFGMAAKMAANPEPMSLATAIEHTKDSNFLPRDLLLRAAYGKAYQVILPDGTVMRPAPHVAPIQAESEFMGALLIKTGTQNVPGNTPTVVTWQATEFDEGAWTNFPGQPSRITIPAGVAFVRFSAGIALQTATTSAQQFMTMLKNGAVGWNGRFTDARVSGQFFQASSPPLQVAVGDYFELRVTFTTAEVIDATDQTYFAVEAL